MSELVLPQISRLLELAGPTRDDVLEEIEEHGREIEFPTVGNEVGSLFRLCARMVDAESIFEFGSGFGYSAYWFAEALPDDGRIVLTEHDADELELAQEYFERGEMDHKAVFEQGNALEIIEEYDGPFDVVLIDHQNWRYEAAFDAIRDKVSPGGVVLADNVIVAADLLQTNELVSILDGESPDNVNKHTRGIADYYHRLQSDPEFETILLPVGEGVMVSYKR
jgi:caffeoyl-CoA O-methyltransferase